MDRFRALKTEKPRSKMALVRGLYPEIAATLQMGHTLKDIHQRLVEDGERSPFVQKRQPTTVPAPAERAPAVRKDPLASAMRALSKPRYDIREAMCDGDPTKKKLI